MERAWQHRRASLEASESSAKEGRTWQNSRSQHLIRRCPFLTHCSLGARTMLNHVSHQHSSSQLDTWAPPQQPPPGRLPARCVGFQLMPTCPSPCIQLWKTFKEMKAKHCCISMEALCRGDSINGMAMHPLFCEHLSIPQGLSMASYWYPTAPRCVWVLLIEHD